MLGFMIAVAVLAGSHLTAARAWIDRLWFVVPAESVTRWLLLVDIGCLAMIGLTLGRPVIAVPATLAAGFFFLNGLALALTDFMLGLASFHVVVAGTTLLTLRGRRWIGICALALVLVLAALT